MMKPMKTTKKNFPKFFLILAILSPTAVLAATPLETARLFYQELLSVSAASNEQENGDRIRSLLDQHFSFDEFYKKALIDHWDSWNQGQKETFHQAFKNAFNENLSLKFDRMKKLKALSGLRWSEKKIEKDLLVTGTGSLDSVEISVDLYLISTQDEWRVCDLDVAGALLSRNYRGSFNYALRRWGFDGLIEKLASKIKNKNKEVAQK